MARNPCTASAETDFVAATSGASVCCAVRSCAPTRPPAMTKVTTSAPTPCSSARRSSAGFVAIMLHMGGPLDSADDPQMGATATEIVGEGLLDVVAEGCGFCRSNAADCMIIPLMQ